MLVDKLSLLKFATIIILLGLSIGVPWSVIGQDAGPKGSIFGLVIVIDVCVIFGWIIKKIHLPPLFGMLLAGFALANIPVINVAININNQLSSSLRSIALAIILVKAGLDLDSEALNKMKGICVRLTVIPCFIEAFTCGIVCHFLLDFSWGWGFLLGFVLGAVTPAVIVPSLLGLQKLGYGVAKGIPSLVIAASSFDDVLAITGFSLILGIVFSDTQTQVDKDGLIQAISNTTTAIATTADLSTPVPESSIQAGEIALKIARGPLEMLGGITAGVLIGVVLWYLPNKKQKHSVAIRSILVVSFGIFALCATRQLDVPGAGALIAIIAPFVAAMKWPDTKEQISSNVGLLWIGFEPIMFGLIGAEIRLDKLDSATIGLGLAALLICLLFRLIGTFCAVSCAGFNLKEKLFLCFAWLPKATVQAAIGGVALDTAREKNAPDEIIETCEQILTISVLSILITAPIGAAIIGITGPKFLEKNEAVELTECTVAR